MWNISGSRQDLVENITIHSSRHCKELFGFLVGGLALAVGAALVDDLLKHQSIFAKASFITTEVRWNWITAGIKTCSSIRCSCRSQARTSPCKCSRAIAPVIIIRSDITRSVELRVNSPRLLGIPQDLSWSQGSNLKRGSPGAVLELVKSVQVEVGKVHGRKALTKAKAQILGSQRSMNLEMPIGKMLQASSNMPWTTMPSGFASRFSGLKVPALNGPASIVRTGTNQTCRSQRWSSTWWQYPAASKVKAAKSHRSSSRGNGGRS